MTTQLVALFNGREIGRITRDGRGRLTFVYAQDWRQAQGAYPLSLSMPLAAAEHSHKPVEAFLWGLLPDNTAVLDRWARRFQVSARNPFALTANSQVMRFEDQVAIVIERYDRQRTEAGLVRVHQEDMCQALAIPPTVKYENEGGPGARAIVDLIRTFSGRPDEDVRRFVDALTFNWLIGGTDAHAKNYSMLIGEGGRARLAPLYDIASILPYNFDLQKIRSAMKIGSEYRICDIGPRQWRKLAKDLRLDAEALLPRIRDIARSIPDALADVCRTAEAEGLDHPLIERLSSKLGERVQKCAQSIEIDIVATVAHS
jgi:serine/threonine-protein kinase HipA